MEENNIAPNVGARRVNIGPPIIDKSLSVPLTKFSNEYDEGYRPGFNQTWNRSANQSGIEQLGYGLLSRTLSIAPKIGAGLGSIYGLGLAAGDGSYKDIWDNPVTNWFNSLDDSIKESLPAYSSEKYDTGDLLSKLGTTSFWANDAFDGFAYALSAFVPGTVIGKALGAGSKLLKASDAGKKIIGGLNKIGVNSQRANLALSTAYNTITEASAEAFQTQKELEAIYEEKGFTPEQAKIKAAEGAARVFNVNLAALAVPNLVQNSLFHGGWDASKKGVQESIWKSLVKKEEIKFNQSLWKNIGGSVASEGFWEENIQTSLQQWEKNAAHLGKSTDNRGLEIGLNMADNAAGFFKSFMYGSEETPEQIEGATSIFLGGLIGGSAALRSHIIEKKQFNKQKEQAQTRFNDLIENYGKAADKVFVDNVGAVHKNKGKKIVKQEDKEFEITDYEVDEKGNAILDSEALNKFGLNSLRNKHLWDAQMLALYENDPALGELNKQMALASYAHSLLTNKHNYTSEEIDALLDQHVEIGTEEAKALGITTYIKENMEQAKAYVKEFEGIRDKRSSLNKADNANLNDALFDNFIAKTEFYLSAKKKALEKISAQTTTEAGKENVNKLIEDTDKYLHEIRNNVTEIRKEFNDTVVTRETLRGKLNTAIKDKKLDEAIGLSYKVQEDTFINGDWGGINSSRSLTTQEAREGVAATPGSRDFFQYQEGRSVITTNRVAEALEAKDDPVAVAAAFNNGIKVIPKGYEDVIAEQANTITSELADEADELNREIADTTQLVEFLDGAKNNSDLLDLSIYEAFSGELDDDAIEAFIEAINANGGQFTPESILEDVYNSSAYGIFRNIAGDKLISLKDRSRMLDEEMAKLFKFQNNTETDFVKGYNEAADKEEFLKRDFYRSMIGDNVQTFIDEFDLNPEEFMNDYALTSHINSLKAAIAGADLEDVVKDAKKKLDYLVDVITPQLQKNVNNAVQIQGIINNKIVSSILSSISNDFLKGKISDEAVDFISKMRSTVQQGTDIGSFDSVLALIGYLKESSSTEIEEVIDKAIASASTNLLTDIGTTFPQLKPLADTYDKGTKFSDNIAFTAKTLLEKFYSLTGRAVPNEVIKFFADVDFYGLMRSVERSKLDLDERAFIVNLGNTYLNIIGLKTAKALLNPKIDSAKLIAFKDRMTITPSLQQNIAMTQAIAFLLSDSEYKNYDNWLIVRGIGGSGKTHFLGKQLSELFENQTGSKANVFAFAKETEASNNIREAMGIDKKNPSSFEIFNELTEEQLSKFDYIVIDEVFTFTNDEIAEIQSKAIRAKVKVVALGDPSQISAEKNIQLLSFLKPSYTLPLSTSYRTNISSISAFIEDYRLKSVTPQQPVAISNKSVKALIEDPSTALGVIGVTNEELFAALERPSTRSRVLIVPTQNLVAELSSKLPKGVAIKTPKTAQGIQWDEVYSIVPNPSEDTAFESNRILYTTYSRAKYLVVIADPSIQNGTPSETLESSIIDSQQQLARVAEDYTTNIEQAKAFQKLLGIAPGITSEEVTSIDQSYGDEPVTAPGVSWAMAADDVVIEPDSTPNATPYQFAEPSNFGVMDFEDASRLAKGSKAYIVKTKTGKLWVVGQNQFDEKKFFKIALISKEDFENPLLKDFLKDVSNVKSFEVSDSQLNTDEFEIPDPNLIAAAAITITDFTKFKTLFGSDYQFKDDLNKSDDIVEDLIIRFYLTYYGNKVDKQEKPWVIKKGDSFKVVWENIPADAVTMVIPTKAKEKSENKKYNWRDSYHNPNGLNIFHGIPYLVVRPTPTHKPILIRLQPKNLAKDHPYVTTLRELLVNVKIVESETGKLLGSSKFEDLIEQYKVDNYTIEEGKLTLVGKTNSLGLSEKTEVAVRNIIESIYSVKYAVKEFRTEENAQKFLDENGVKDENNFIINGRRITGIIKRANNSFVFSEATDINDPTAVELYREHRIETGHGEAQIALNTLARANVRIDERVIRSKQKMGRMKTPISRAQSILSSTAYTDYIGFYSDPLVVELFTEEEIARFKDEASDPDKKEGSTKRMLEALTDNIVKIKGENPIQARDIAWQMLSFYTANPINSATLEAVVGETAFDSDNRHTSLRTPLDINNAEKTGIHDVGDRLADKKEGKVIRRQLTQQLKHNFQGIQRTAIFFSSPELIELPDKKPEVDKGKLSDVLMSIKPTNNPTYDSIINFLRKVKAEAEILYVKEAIPIKDKDGNITYIKGASTIVTNGVTTVTAQGVTFDNINKNVNVLHLFLHESMHVISKEALFKGKSDNRKKIDSPEALLYRRMMAIKKRFDSAIRSKKDAQGNRLRTIDVYQRTPSKLDVDEFVANLANPDFVEYAKSISLIPSGERKSLLREILETIVSYFRSIFTGDMSVYDAAIASLEDFYANLTPTLSQPLPTPIQPQVVFKYDDVVLEITKTIESAKAANFDSIVNKLRAQFIGIIDVDSLPREYGDEVDIYPDNEFNSQPDEVKSLLIARAKGLSSDAFFNIPKNRIEFTSGAIDSQITLDIPLGILMPEGFTNQQRNLVKSIILESSKENNVLDDVLTETGEDLIDYLYENVFSALDRQRFREMLEVSTDNQVKQAMVEEGFLGLELVQVLNFLDQNHDTFSVLIERNKDNGVERYRTAKQYIENIIKGNLDLGNSPNAKEVIKTPLEIKEHIETAIKDLDVTQDVVKLEELYNSIGNLNKELVNPNKKVRTILEEISKLEAEVAAKQSLTKKDVGTGSTVLDLILKDIYPNTKFSVLQDFETELFSLAEDDLISKETAELESTDISEHIKKYDQSYENTLSESLKNSFRKITLGDKAISPGLAYVKTMQLVMSLDWNLGEVETLAGKNRSFGLDYIIAQLNEELKNTSSELSKTIITNLINTINTAKSRDFLDGVNVDINDDYTYGILSYKAEDGVIRYAAYKANKSIDRANALTYQKVEYLSNQGEDVKLLTPLTNHSNVLYTALAKEGFSIPQYNRLFAIGDSVNVIRAVHNTMASMKETNLYTANRSNQQGNEFTFQRAIASGPAFKFKEQIISNLKVTYEAGDLKDMGTRFMAKKIGDKNMSEIKKKHKYLFIKSFFEELGIPVSDFIVPRAKLNEVINDIDGFLSKLDEIEPFNFSTQYDEAEDTFDLEKWLETSQGVDGYLTRFSRIIGSSDKLVRNSSVKDGQGNKFYVNHESSHLYDTLLNLIEVDKNNPVFRGGTGSDVLRTIPDFIKSDYYDHNIFVRGSVENKMHSVIEIDGSKNLGNNAFTAYLRQNMFYFFHTNFSQQFVDSLKQFKGSYFQSTYVPSDSPKALAVRVNILSDRSTSGEVKDTEIYKAIESALLQLLEKKQSLGSSYENFENSVSKDLYRNFKVGELAETKLGVTLSAATLPKMAQFIYDQLGMQAEELLNELTSEGVELSLDINTYQYASRIANKTNPVYDKITSEWSKITKAQTRNAEGYAVDRETLRPLFELWYKNDYLNSYFLNQLVLGDYAAFKNTSAIIKRFTGAKAPRIRGLVDPVLGMNQNYKTLVLSDTKKTKDGLRETFNKLIYGDNIPEQTPEVDEILSFLKDEFESTDAQGFLMPRRVAELSMGYESAWGVGDVTKPVYFGTTKEVQKANNAKGTYSTAIPQYNKYSAVHLTSKMTDKFPALRLLHDLAVKLNVDEIIFESGFKVGKPKLLDSLGKSQKAPTLQDLFSYDDDQILDFRDKWQQNSIVTLSNSSHGFQFNAQADPNKKVSLFTQLMYIINAYPDTLANSEFPTTQEAAKEVYRLIGALIKDGNEGFMSQVNTKAKLRSFIKSNLKGPGAERALQLINGGLSIDNPLIEKKAIISIASGLEKATIKTKFKGGKLVLQTPEAIDKYQDLELFGDIDASFKEGLNYRKEVINGKEIYVAEVIVPKELLTAEQLEALRAKKSIYLLADMLGFRIPTTELHSAVAMRVVGIYSNKRTNVVIAPKELIPIQGQDFDVDSLFVITKETISEKEEFFISGDVLSSFISSVNQVLLDITFAEKQISDKNKGYLKRLKTDILEILKLSIDPTLDEEDSNFNNMLANLEKRLAKLSNENSDELKELYLKISKSLETLKSGVAANTLTAGNIDTPVGYNKVDGLYEIDSSFLELIDSEIAIYNSLNVPQEFKKVLGPVINKELSTLKSLRTKYLKNRVIDIMLEIVSNESNVVRTFSGISFAPLDDALTYIPKDLMTNIDSLDLSNVRDRFKAYLSVSSGAALIGAFANGSKSFGYISRAGDDSKFLDLFKQTNLLKALIKKKGDKITSEDIKPFINYLSDFYKSIVTTPEEIETLNKVMESISTYTASQAADTLIEAFKVIYKNTTLFKAETLNQDLLPALNPKQTITISENSNTIIYDRLRDVDSDGKNKTTQAYSTLTNAAVDDLNEGFLSRTRINTNTGSAVIGMVALGVPFRVIIKLLYQPILSSLSGGKINKLDGWYSAIYKEYEDAIDELDGETLSVNNDLDVFINNTKTYKYQNMGVLEMLKSMTPSERTSQLKALVVFMKAHRIGEDSRNLSKFLNIIRSWSVFTHDMATDMDNLHSKIGKPLKNDETGDVVLQPNLEFSFYIPNLFNNSEHIKQGYLAFTGMIDLIKNNFLVHNPSIESFADSIRVRLNLYEDDSANLELSKIKSSLQHYLMSSKIATKLKAPRIATYKNKKTKKETKFLVSGSRSFMDKVAKDIKLIKDYAQLNGHNNAFLDNLVTTYDRYNLARISYRTPSSLKNDDMIDMLIGFKNLNRYKIVDGQVITLLPSYPNEVSQIQSDLRDYAILSAGVSYAGNGFSSFIPAHILRDVDSFTNKKLQDIIDYSTTDQFKSHFALSYTMLNASKLPFIRWEDIHKVNLADKGEKANFDLSGIDTVKTEKAEKKVYYDLKVIKDSNKAPKYIRRQYGKNSITVYRKVLATDEAAYYQIVGSANNVVFEPVDQTDASFDSTKLFNPFSPFIGYSLINETSNTFETNSRLMRHLNVGEVINIYPDYSYDRINNIQVEILSKSKSDTGGILVKYKQVEAKPKENKKLIDLKVLNLLDSGIDAEDLGNEVLNLVSDTKPVQIYKGFWTREEVALQPDKLFLFGDNAEDFISGYVPKSTQAVIRGLPNALGIITKRNRFKSDSSYLNDQDFDAFKEQLDSVIEEALSSGLTIVIPEDGIGTGAAKLKEKAPLLFDYLAERLGELIKLSC